ncbi:MAG: hypothetical protein V3W50_05645 [Thermoanaerobaculia bacterium]
MAISVSFCYCRHKAEHLGRQCEAPQEICLSLNGGAELVLRRGFGRAIEALNRLPASQKLLAREQVKSRFVRQALRSLGGADSLLARKVES